MKKRVSKSNIPLCIFTISYITVMFFPRLVQKGLYVDGLCYSSIARNMALGIGSFWKPYFSSTFWLPYNTGEVFYEHLPMQFGLQSLFFKLFGDHWYVEKIYSFVVLAITLWLMVALWRLVFEDEFTKSRAWLPLVLFYTMPEIIWAAPNNLLENTMTVFVLIAAYFFIKALYQGKFQSLYISLAGIAVFLSFLTKGPVGLFPLAIPFIHFLVFRKYSFLKSLWFSILATFVFAASMGLIMLIPSANEFIRTFIDQQLLSALSGAREQGHQGWGHFSVFRWLMIGLSPVFGLTILILLVNMLIQRKVFVDKSTTPTTLFFLLIGIAGSFPIALSAKQFTIYYIPSLPYFALVFAALMVPAINYFFTRVNLSIKASKYVNGSLIVLFMVAVVYSVSITAQPGREHKMHYNLEKITKVIPDDTKVVVCLPMMSDAYLHAYMQRYYRIELTLNPDESKYLLLDGNCDPNIHKVIEEKGFSLQSIPDLHDYQVYIRNHR